MTEMKPDIDLAALARVKSDDPPPRRFHRLWFLPLLVGVAFLGILWSTLGDLLTDSKEVTVVRPRPSAAGARIGSVVLQAAGWVEPDPFPSKVTPLTPGVIREVLVQESESVERGQVVARLIDRDRALEYKLAQATTRAATAKLRDAQSELTIAEEAFEAALEVRESLAVAESEEAAHLEECAREAAAAEVAGAKLKVAKAELETQLFLEKEQAAGPWQVELATARVAELEAAHRSARAQAARAIETLSASQARAQRARRSHELRLEDRLRVAKAEAAVELHESLVAEAESREALARQRLDWCQVRTPVSGIVLERLAMPGSTVGDGSGAVCTIYDRASLRVRIDVPQSDIALMELEQEAQVGTYARPNQPYRGKVIRIVQRADIQKVTLEVQVEILDEDSLLRPEMLCQVRFLAPAREEEEVNSNSKVYLVPERLVDGDSLWVLDASGQEVRRRSVSLGGKRGDEVEVLEGINLSDKLIDQGRSGLEDGDSVQVRNER